MELFSNLPELLKHLGHIGIIAIIFAESGILAGFFLPGDSLLFTAGFLTHAGYLNLWVILIGGSLAAIAGDSFGYYLGRKFGPKIFNRDNSRIFHRDHVDRAANYFARYGPITIVLARFTPFIRTFAPVLAGVGNMNYSKFVSFNIIGGILWVFSMTLLGYFLGEIIPNVDRYVLPIVGAILIISVIPAVIGLVKAQRRRPDKKLPSS